MDRPDLVIFDCDGVLVDTEGPTNGIIAADLTRRGLAITPAECMELFVGGTIAGVGRQAAEMGADIPEGWTDLIYADIYAHLRKGVDPIAGIELVLDALDAAGIPYCVGSNGAPEKMDITLGGTGLLARFNGNLFSPHVIGMDKAKPDPGLYLHAARAMGVPPARTIVVEDSATGARAARAAGMRCIGYAGETPRAKLEAMGAVIITDMAELPPLIGL